MGMLAGRERLSVYFPKKGSRAGANTEAEQGVLLEATSFSLTKERYYDGLTWESYLGRMRRNGELMTDLLNGFAIDEGARKAFAHSVARRGGQIAVAVMTEDWCGDSAVNLPVIARLAHDVPGIELRIFIGSENLDIKAGYESEGLENIPLVSFFDSGFAEIGRWMERPKAATARVEAWTADHPEIAEIGMLPDPERKEGIRAYYDRLLQEMAGWYRGGLWRETLREIGALLAEAPAATAPREERASRQGNR